MTKSKRARYAIEFKLEAVRMVQGGQSLAVVSDISDPRRHINATHEQAGVA